MKHHLRIAAMALAVTAGVTSQSHAQSSADSDWEDVDLLEGRLVISVPPGTELAPNEAANIMAAAPSEEMATKLIVPLGQSENDIVVYVNELFGLFPQDPETHFRENYLGGMLEDRNAPPRNQLLASSLRAYGAFEGMRRHSSGNYVLADILVAQPDGMTQEIFIMTWDQSVEILEYYSMVASRMIASLRPGPRKKLASGGRQFIQATLRDGRSLQFAVNLPDGYFFSKQRGPDFLLYRIAALAPLDAPAGGLGIYIGWHPSMTHERNGVPTSELTRTAARIAGHRSEWVEYQSEDAEGGPNWIHRDAILPLEQDHGSRAKMHIFMAAPEGTGEIDRLTRMVEMQLRPVEP